MHAHLLVAKWYFPSLPLCHLSKCVRSSKHNYINVLCVFHTIGPSACPACPTPQLHAQFLTLSSFPNCKHQQTSSSVRHIISIHPSIHTFIQSPHGPCLSNRTIHIINIEKRPRSPHDTRHHHPLHHRPLRISTSQLFAAAHNSSPRQHHRQHRYRHDDHLHIQHRGHQQQHHHHPHPNSAQTTDASTASSSADAYSSASPHRQHKQRNINTTNHRNNVRMYSPPVSSAETTCSNVDNANAPSRWYTVLALPFPDQRLGRRDISTFGRGVYASRAGFFSNPL